MLCDGSESSLTTSVVGLVAGTTALCSVCTEATGASPTMLRPAPSGKGRQRLRPAASAARSPFWIQPLRARNNGAAALFEEVARGDAQ